MLLFCGKQMHTKEAETIICCLTQNDPNTFNCRTCSGTPYNRNWKQNIQFSFSLEKWNHCGNCSHTSMLFPRGAFSAENDNGIQGRMILYPSMSTIFDNFHSPMWKHFPHFFCGKQIQTKEENSHFLQSQIKRQTYFTVPPNQRSKIQNTIENEITIDKMHQNGNLWKCLKLKITFLTDIQSPESKCNRVLSNCSWNNLSLFHIHHIKWSSPFSYLYYLTVCVSFQRGAEDREEE